MCLCLAAAPGMLFSLGSLPVLATRVFHLGWRALTWRPEPAAAAAPAAEAGAG